jgi:N-acetyl-anhydromuramyl-L-alanine amidase AmpD
MRKINSIVIHHSAGTQETSLEAIILMHRRRGMQTIGYHHYIFKENGKWVGKRGRRDAQVGAHAKGFNERSLGICLAGNYENQVPEEESLDILVDTIAKWCSLYSIPVEEIYGHRQVGTTATVCPGANLFKIIGQIKERVQHVLSKTNT